MPPTFNWGWLIGGVLGALLLLALARASRRLRLLQDTPTSKARGVFVGQVEVRGAARLAEPFMSWLAGIPCVWFDYTVQEQWERWETQHYRDSKGRSRTRRVRKSGWTTLDSGGQTRPFDVVDDSGSVLVDPEGADLRAVEVMNRVVGMGDPLYYGKGPEAGIANSTGRRRFVERAIPLDHVVFVAGRARERPDVVAAMVAQDPAQDFFIITCGEETSVARGYRVTFWLCGILVVALPPVGGLVGAHVAEMAPPSVALLATSAALGLAAWVLVWIWGAFNSLVHLRNRVAQAWSLVDVQLKRRADLIPRLVDTVAAMRGHEREVQESLAALRTQAAATPAWMPGPDVHAARATVVALAERYPELTAAPLFTQLMRELADTESRIALARDYFNAIATHANTRCAIVPDRFVARLAGLRERPLLEAQDFERAAVRVAI